MNIRPKVYSFSAAQVDVMTAQMTMARAMGFQPYWYEQTDSGKTLIHATKPGGSSDFDLWFNSLKYEGGFAHAPHTPEDEIEFEAAIMEGVDEA